MTTSWRGWPGRAAAGDDGLVELSHKLTAGLPNPAYFPEPAIGRIMELGTDGLNLTRMAITCHFGTHVDAPSHVFEGAPSIDEVPLDRFSGPAVAWRIEADDDGEIDADVLERATPACQPGEMVLLSTGWSNYVDSDRYNQHPSLTLAAAEWLVAHEVKLLGIDFMTPELPIPRRRPGFDFPVHRVLLGAGTLIAENLTNLDRVEGRRVAVELLPLPIAGADGSPVRAIARDLVAGG